MQRQAAQNANDLRIAGAARAKELEDRTFADGETYLTYQYTQYTSYVNMKTIEIDDEVYRELERRVRGFHQTENEVLRIELGLGKATDGASKNATPRNGELDAFLNSQEYTFAATADERYLKLLSWLLKRHTDLQQKIDGYRTRTRIYFSADPKSIQVTSQNVNVKPIPHSQLHAMVTLSNSSKRKIIAHILRVAGYPKDHVQRAAETFPDSGIRRGQSILSGYR